MVLRRIYIRLCDCVCCVFEVVVCLKYCGIDLICCYIRELLVVVVDWTVLLISVGIFF